jgi:galactose mutarotase-like enzyme
VTRAEAGHATHQPSVVSVRHPRGALAASICPRRGGELSSLTLNCGENPVELLYRGNDFAPVAPGEWRGRGPWLWPAAGRCYVDEDAARIGTPGFDRDACTWRCGNEKLSMHHHGFAKDTAWRAEATGDPSRKVLRHVSDGRHHDVYPFDFALQTETAATANGLTMRFVVKADDANAAPMPFQLGLHLTFDFAQWWGASWLDGTVCGLGATAYDVDMAMQPNNRVTLPGQGVRMNDPIADNKLIPASTAPAVQLTAPDGSSSLKMRFATEPAFGADDALWVTHRDPQCRYFCCEPWVGWPNALNSNRGSVQLEPGATWRWTLQLSVD